MTESPTPTQSTSFWKGAFPHILVIILCIAGGRLGLELTIPPGYTSLLWPPTGIVLGLMVIYGWRLIPSILIAAFILNGYVSGLLDSPDVHTALDKAIPTLIISSGFTLQAIAGYVLLKKYFGIPLAFQNWQKIIGALTLTGPIACLVSSGVALTTLYTFGYTTLEQMGRSWFSWWIGDTFGVIIFLPLTILAIKKTGTETFTWKNAPIPTLPLVRVLVALLPLGLTFYLWGVASERSYEQAYSEFKSITRDNENALVYRLDSYAHALLGGMAFYQNQPDLTRSQWNSYVSMIPLKESYPGINGFGVIFPVSDDKIETFITDAKKDGAPAFNIHPTSPLNPKYVIKYIYPEGPNKQAIGLDIGFEKNRREAADISRDTGKPAITKKIILVQDQARSPGFLLLYPIYKKGIPITTTEERRKNFIGWIYAPFVAKNFLQNLTPGQDVDFTLSIYDGSEQKAENLIFSTRKDISRHPTYSIEKKINILQQDWTIVWESTINYEHQEENEQPFYILILGVFLSDLCILFLVMFSLRQSTLEQMTKERGYIIPAIVFFVCLCGSFFLFKVVYERETNYIRTLITQDAERLVALVTIDSQEVVSAISRLGQRWTTSNRTEEKLWKQDTQNYIHDFPSLQAIYWIDKDKKIQRESYRDTFTERSTLKSRVNNIDNIALMNEAQRLSRPLITEPMAIKKSNLSIISYLPVIANGKFDGFIMTLSSIPDFLNGVMKIEGKRNYYVDVRYQKDVIYAIDDPTEMSSKFLVQRHLSVLNKDFLFSFMPNAEYAEQSTGFLPQILFIVGLIISGLMATTTRAILLARVRAAHLKKATILAESANIAKSTFLSNISHEIRTPLNGVLSTVELLDKTILDSKQKRYVRIIQGAGELLLNLLNDVLDLSKIETMKFELHETPFNLRKAIVFSTELFSLSAHEKSLELNLEIAPNLPEFIMGNSHRFNQILTNLVGNAVKYTERGGIQIEAILKHENNTPILRIDVKDTGIGIPEASIETLFGRFSQVHKLAKISGTGLGLAIAKSLVELMKGKISVISQEGLGSKFWFEIPIQPVSAPIETSTIEIHNHTSGQDKQDTLKILFVEDVETNREIISEIFQHLGCDVDTAEDGQQAIDRCATTTYDIIFMDCNMPVMDGYEATRRLRKTHGNALPIIAISAHAFMQDIQLCFDAGMDDYVTKPVKMEALEQAIQKWGKGKALKPRETTTPTETPTTLETNINNQIDESVLPTLCQNKPEKIIKLAGMTLRNAVDIHTEIHNAVTQRSWDDLCTHAHSLKSIAAQVGGNHLAALCLRVEKTRGTSKNATEIQEMIRDLDAAFDVFQAYLEKNLS